MPKSSVASSAADAAAPPPVAIVGATATGKTAVGILVAEALGTEIVGCDSRQIYRRLDIGTAKPTPAERARVRHHLVDVADPAESYSAARYRAQVQALLPAFRAAGRPLLLVGGTGLYLRAALAGLCQAPAADPGLRRWLGALAGTLPGGLHPLLARVDAAAAARIHPHDRYRIVRALEVFYLGGETLSARHERHRAQRPPAAAARLFAIALPPAELRRRIELRLEAMLAAGLLDEVRGLLGEGLDAGSPALRAVGYPQLIAHLRGDSSLDDALAAVRRATWQYARRQLTWFRAVPGVVWLPAQRETPPEALAERVLAALSAGEAA